MTERQRSAIQSHFSYLSGIFQLNERQNFSLLLLKMLTAKKKNRKRFLIFADFKFPYKNIDIYNPAFGKIVFRF